MYTEIKTVEAAFEKHPDKIDLKKTIEALAELPKKFSSGMIALLTLQVVVWVVNNDDGAVPEWQPDYNNKDQRKWFPWYIGGDKSGAGFRFDGSDYGWTHSSTDGGARLALKDEARVGHMNEYFKGLYKELFLVLE